MTARTAPAPTNSKAPAAGRRTGEQTASDLAFYARTMKAPALLDAAERLAERARAESWTHTEFLAACLQREVAARESHGGEARIRAARFPAIKTIEELDVSHLRGMTREQIAHLGTLDFITGKENAVFLGPPGSGKRTWRSESRSAPARPATASRSPPPPSGSTASQPPTTPDACRASSPSSAAIP